MCDFIIKPTTSMTPDDFFKPYPDIKGTYLVDCGLRSIYPIVVKDGDTYITIAGRNQERIAVKLVALHCDGILMHVTPKGYKNIFAKYKAKLRAWFIRRILISGEG